MSGPLRLAAPAKLNLYLELRGRRADGFHELVTVMTTLELADDVTLSLRARRGSVPAGQADISLTCRSEAPFRGELPERPERNLASLAAARLLAERGQLDALGVEIELVKRVPAGGGLGGGSSDAAAVLLGLARLLDGDASPERLTPLAATLGSDVPFFLYGGTCLCTGRGEQVQPINSHRSVAVLLMLPPFGVSTPAVYAALQAPPCMRSAAPDQLDALAASIADADASALSRLFRNDLSAAALRCEPRLANMLAQDGVMLSGSGSTMFSLGQQTPPAISASNIAPITYVRTFAGGAL